MNQINNLPGDTVAGTDFNYTVWTAGTVISLCSVPWNNDYRDVVNFSNENDLDVYLAGSGGPTVVIDSLTYAKPNVPVRIQVPYTSCYAYNYLRVHNDVMPIPNGLGKTLYYFILDVRYVAPNTTELVIQLDVWQTFGRMVQFGNAYIERGHLPMAIADSFDDHGRTYLTIPEGLDLGNEYTIRAHYGYELCGTQYGQTLPTYDLIVVSTTSLVPPYGDVSAPVLQTAYGTRAEGLPNGADVYWFPHSNSSAFSVLMGQLSTHPWIAQGIISITAIPPLNLNPAEMTRVIADTTLTDEVYAFYKTSYYTGGVPNQVVELADATWRDYVLGQLPPRYQKLKKFLTFPYCVVEMTSYTGSPLLLKPECIPTENIEAVKLMHYAPPNPCVLFAPYKYNAGDNMPTESYKGQGYDGGEFLDMTTGFHSFPTFSVVNNSYLGYMAANKNTIAYQHTSADWSQQRALQGAQTAFVQQNAAIDASLMSTGSQVNQNTRQATLNYDAAGAHGAIGAGVSALQGIDRMAGGDEAGGLLGLVTGVTSNLGNAAVEMSRISQSNAFGNIGLAERSGYGRNAQSIARDTNLDYAKFAASGDYQNAIAGINAKVQDAKMIQPTTSGQIGGDAFLLANYKWGVFANVKVPNSAAVQQIGDFWLRYGYAMNRFIKIKTLSVMSKFTYWKMRETYIISQGVPEGFRQTIRGIFEKGVTVWTTPSDIGNIDLADNTPLEGITL